MLTKLHGRSTASDLDRRVMVTTAFAARPALHAAQGGARRRPICRSKGPGSASVMRSSSDAATLTTPPWSPIDAEMISGDIKYNEQGLVPAIAQQHNTGEVLMMAWMNAESLRETLSTGRVVYFSRGRGKLWRKGESSGQVQSLVKLHVDCDGDTLLLQVDQAGVACHTGRRSCFYRAAGKDGLTITQEVQIDPEQLYQQ